MKPPKQTPYRFYRPRRPGGLGDGLRLEGMSSKFGLMGIGVLVLVGILMLMVTNIPNKNELGPIDIELTAPPYITTKYGKTVLLPITRARVLSLNAATFEAVDSNKLFALAKGDMLKAWLTAPEAQNWMEGVGRKDFYTAILLQQKSGEWLVDYGQYRRKAARFSNQGWWLILLGCLLLPYQLLHKPKFPIWAAIVCYILFILCWAYLF